MTKISAVEVSSKKNGAKWLEMVKQKVIWGYGN
jgi:hypothetical protein